ncbi:MAG: gamma-glutamylcyclotransferase family protein [Planctomycetota bacterium]
MPVVFAYGCLMDASVMGRVCPGAEPWAGWAEPARSAGRLAGHRLAFPIGRDGDWGAAVAGVVADGSAAVEGGLWVVPEAGLAELDAYEEVAEGVYERGRCAVALLRTGRGEPTVAAWVYKATAASAGVGEHRPGATYRAALLRGADFFDLSGPYRRQLAAIDVADGGGE